MFRLRLTRPVLGTLFASLALAALGIAQSAPPPSETMVWRYDSGLVENATSAPAVVASFTVSIEGAAWLRLHFAAIELAGDADRGSGSTLRIVSAHDGAEQTLTARRAREWGNTSAYFNGDTLLVELIAEPGTGANRVALSTVVAGFATVSVSQCGLIDDRVPSDDPRVARLLPPGCTAWLVHDCAYCFLTAGHCVGANLVAQFNVPLSTAQGTLVHPPPADQYAFDPLSLQFQVAGEGDDWASFGCFPNATTGLTPFEKQRDAYVIDAPPAFDPAGTIRVTGFGLDTDPASANYTQQTNTGPWLALEPQLLAYQTDTQGGNSGSPVEWEQGGIAVGIHSHGGCDASGVQGNRGTRIDHPALQAALANPRGVCAGGCLPGAVAYCIGKRNSLACTPEIGWSGLPSATAGAGSFTIVASDAINHKLGLVFYGTSVEVAPFQGGMLCVGAPLVRTPPQDSGGNVGVVDCSGTYAFDMGARIASGIDPNLTAGATVYAQWWMRDPGSSPHPVGLSNAVAFTIGP